MNRLEEKKQICNYEPPQNMRVYVDVLLSEDVHGNKHKASQICIANGVKGASRQVYDYYFKKYPEFRKYVSERCDLLLGGYEGIAMFSLIGSVIKQDVQALRLFYELRGKLKKADTNIGVNIENKVNYVWTGVKEDSIPAHWLPKRDSLQPE